MIIEAGHKKNESPQVIQSFRHSVTGFASCCRACLAEHRDEARDGVWIELRAVTLPSKAYILGG